MTPQLLPQHVAVAQQFFGPRPDQHDGALSAPSQRLDERIDRRHDMPKIRPGPHGKHLDRLLPIQVLECIDTGAAATAILRRNRQSLGGSDQAEPYPGHRIGARHGEPGVVDKARNGHGLDGFADRPGGDCREVSSGISKTALPSTLTGTPLPSAVVPTVLLMVTMPAAWHRISPGMPPSKATTRSRTPNCRASPRASPHQSISPLSSGCPTMTRLRGLPLRAKEAMTWRSAW